MDYNHQSPPPHLRRVMETHMALVADAPPQPTQYELHAARGYFTANGDFMRTVNESDEFRPFIKHRPKRGYSEYREWVQLFRKYPSFCDTINRMIELLFCSHPIESVYNTYIENAPFPARELFDDDFYFLERYNTLTEENKYEIRSFLDQNLWTSLVSKAPQKALVREANVLEKQLVYMPYLGRRTKISSDDPIEEETRAAIFFSDEGALTYLFTKKHHELISEKDLQRGQSGQMPPYMYNGLSREKELQIIEEGSFYPLLSAYYLEVLLWRQRIYSPEQWEIVIRKAIFNDYFKQELKNRDLKYRLDPERLLKTEGFLQRHDFPPSVQKGIMKIFTEKIIKDFNDYKTYNMEEDEY